jgi:pyridoxine 5-phosphate synthase
MIALHVNVDHVATLRQARRTTEPDPIAAAAIAELNGADGITVHLREDRRHIQDRDVHILRETVKTVLNLEMAVTDPMLEIALQIRPEVVTLVPEKREEITTEGGLDVAVDWKRMCDFVKELVNAEMRVSLFVDPDPQQIEASAKVQATEVELHTGTYANLKSAHRRSEQWDRLAVAAEAAHQHGLQVNAGHGLTYHNTRAICKLPHLRELNIGHSIISRSVLYGLAESVREMRRLIDEEVAQHANETQRER